MSLERNVNIRHVSEPFRLRTQKLGQLGDVRRNPPCLMCAGRSLN